MCHVTVHEVTGKLCHVTVHKVTGKLTFSTVLRAIVNNDCIVRLLRVDKDYIVRLFRDVTVHQ